MSYWGISWHSSDVLWCWPPFCELRSYLFFLCDMCIQIFWLFLQIGLFVLLLLIVKSFLYILDVSSLSNMYITCIFSSLWFDNSFLMLIFDEQKLLIFMTSDVAVSSFLFFFLNIVDFLKKIYLPIFRQKGRERDWERNVNVWLPLTHPHWEPGPQPRNVPWLGIKPVTLWFAGWRSIHWAIPVRAVSSFMIRAFYVLFKKGLPFQRLWYSLKFYS